VNQRRPDFFVIGAQRAGTTRLCHLLARHPAIGFPTKEPFYFQSVDAMIEKRSWYESLFATASKSILGDGSTYYSMAAFYPGTAARIFAWNPEARVIYMVRHPLRRIGSAWQHLLSVGHVSSLRSFKSAVMKSDILIEPTLYWKQIDEYRSYFPDRQLHIIFFEEFVRAEEETVRRCADFVGAPPVAVDVPALGADRNGSSGMQQAWMALDAVRAIPGYTHLKRTAPRAAKKAVTDRMRRPIGARVVWDQELYDYAEGRLRADSVRFLRHTGRADSYWPWDGAGTPAVNSTSDPSSPLRRFE
jgi:hypothetical protein